MLNFFTTLTSSGSICGPSANLECRGADNAAEFTRQRDKLLAALSAINADIFGLVELENNASASAQSLVDGLNTLLGAGTYAYINTGTIGSDAIKVGSDSTNPPGSRRWGVIPSSTPQTTRTSSIPRTARRWRRPSRMVTAKSSPWSSIISSLRALPAST